jgi:hypothetical protein
MTNSSEELFRQAAEEEGGKPVSAGARGAQVQGAVAAGRALYVDLSGVPEAKRPALVAEIKELVNHASTGAQQHESHREPKASHASD